MRFSGTKGSRAGGALPAQAGKYERSSGLAKAFSTVMGKPVQQTGRYFKTNETRSVMNKSGFATLAIVMAVLYELLLVLLIFLRPDLPVYSTTISEWAIGKFG